MNAEIIAIGSELLLGETVDTNSAYLARQLAATGIGLYRKAVVGDNEERIATMISEALSRVDLVICTGGLGPTVDDMTRDAVARATGRQLEFHQHLLDQIEARFRSFGRTMSPSNRQQAYVPFGARIVENPRGTAPAFIVEETNGTIVVLPGVPSEMKYLWEHAVLPYLRDERGQTAVIMVRTLHATGAGESVIGELVADLMRAENPTLGISAKRAQYELRLGARAQSREEAVALLDHASAIIRERLGTYLIGEQKLEQLVLGLLRERQLSLALHEASVRAPVFQSFQQAGGSDLIRSVQITTTPLGIPASQTEALAREAASKTRQESGADLAIAIQPASQPGDDNFTTVAVALASSSGVQSWSRGVDLNIDENWGFVGTSAFDVIRRTLLA